VARQRSGLKVPIVNEELMPEEKDAFLSSPFDVPARAARRLHRIPRP